MFGSLAPKWLNFSYFCFNFCDLNMLLVCPMSLARLDIYTCRVDHIDLIKMMIVQINWWSDSWELAMTCVEIVDEHIGYVTHDGFGGLDLKTIWLTACQVWSSNSIGVLTGTSESYIEAEQNHEEHVPIGCTDLESNHFTPGLCGLAKITKRRVSGHKRFFSLVWLKITKRRTLDTRGSFP